MSELIETLEGEGLRVSRGGINYAILRGKVSPAPVDGAGNRHFTQQHLDELRRYLSSPRKPGKTPRAKRTADRRQTVEA